MLLHCSCPASTVATAGQRRILVPVHGFPRTLAEGPAPGSSCAATSACYYAIRGPVPFALARYLLSHTRSYPVFSRQVLVMPSGVLSRLPLAGTCYAIGGPVLSALARSYLLLLLQWKAYLWLALSACLYAETRLLLLQTHVDICAREGSRLCHSGFCPVGLRQFISYLLLF